MRTARILRKLIRACVDDECTLRHESKFVDASRAVALGRLASERARFVEDLERLEGGAASRPNASWAELLSKARRNVWVAAAGPNNGDAIASCRHSRVRTEARYDEAMQAALPEEIRRVLAAQRSRLHEEADELNRLRI